jgi:hypothetical protein
MGVGESVAIDCRKYRSQSAPRFRQVRSTFGPDLANPVIQDNGRGRNLETSISSSFQKRYPKIPHPIRAGLLKLHPQRKP